MGIDGLALLAASGVTPSVILVPSVVAVSALPVKDVVGDVVVVTMADIVVSIEVLL